MKNLKRIGGKVVFGPVRLSYVHLENAKVTGYAVVYGEDKICGDTVLSK